MSTPEWALPDLEEQQTAAQGAKPAWALPYLEEQVAQAPQPQPTNPLVAFGSGIVAGALEPFGLIPPVGDVLESLRAYGGDSAASKIGYGLGWLAGFAIPAAGEYKIGAAAARGLKLTRALSAAEKTAYAAKLVKQGKGGAEALAMADKVANFTTRGRLVAGATTGALLGAGMDTDDPAGWLSNVALNAGLGGVGDVVIPAAWNALTARFGKGVSKDVLETLDAVKRGGVPLTDEELAKMATAAPRTDVQPLSKAGLEAHARAMQLFDEVTAPVPERISAAAWRNTDGEIISGPGTHAQVLEKGIAEGKLSTDTRPDFVDQRFKIPDGQTNYGFVTNKGRFIDSNEAAKVSIKQGQFLGGNEHDLWSENVRFAPPSAADEMEDIAAKRLSLKLGLEEIPWARLEPGTIRVVPSVHGDVKELGAILKGAGVQHKVATHAGRTDILVSLGEIDPKLLTLYNKNGFLPGHEVLWGGQKWVALKPTEASPGRVWLTQPGRLKKPVHAPLTREAARGNESLVQPLPIVQVFGDVKVSKLGPLAAQFIDKYGLFVERYVDETARGLPVSRVERTRIPPTKNPVPGAPVPTPAGPRIAASGKEYPGAVPNFLDAFNAFARQHRLSGIDKLRLHDYMTQLQRNALAEFDPELGRTIEMLDTELTHYAAQGLGHPDGPVAEMAAMKGLSYHRALGVDDRWGYVLKNHMGQTLTPKPLSKDEAMTWLRAYGVEPADLAEVSSPLAQNVVPTGGASSLPPHTAGEVSGFGTQDAAKIADDVAKSFHSAPLVNLVEKIFPRWSWAKMMEDSLQKAGLDLKPWTNIILELTQAKWKFRNEMNLWLKGGKAADGSDVKGLLQVFDPKHPRVRAEKKEEFVELLESPRAEWAKLQQKLGLSDSEVQAAGELRTWYNQMWDRFVRDPEIDLTFDDFIENYFPHYRNKADSEALESLKRTWTPEYAAAHGKLNLRVADFASEFTRKGILKKWEKDPFLVSLAYVRAGVYKSTMAKSVLKARDEYLKIPVVGNKDLEQLADSMKQFIQFHAQSVPESFRPLTLAVKNTARLLDLKLSDSQIEELINALVTMNYGAYMSFRPGLALRNFSQMLVTSYPILGAKYLGVGMRHIGNAASKEEARKAGALLAEHMPMPGEEIYADIAQEARAALHEARPGLAGAAVTAAEKVGGVAQKASQKGMKLFTWADDMNRLVSYFGMKEKVGGAAREVFGAGVVPSRTSPLAVKFERKAGMNYFGETVKNEFWNRLEKYGVEEAQKFMGVMAAHDTQWLYQLGAGPSAFSHGLGRLVGQYGTWPTWYAAYWAQGAKNLTGIERAAWGARNLAAHAALIYAGAAVGLNLSRWTGLSSLSWAGGPAVDWLSDLREIVTGVQQSGEPTAGRMISLSNYGMKDYGPGGILDFSLMPHFTVDGQSIGRIGLAPSKPGETPSAVKALMSFFGMFTPGYLAAVDVHKAIKLAENGQMREAIWRSLNLNTESAGYEYPQVTAR